jgi:hypothetical protein
MTTTYALGDLHGDLESAIATLSEHGVVSQSGAWAGGEATLVQLGDMLDAKVRTGRTFSSEGGDLGVLRYMVGLRAQARAVGGDVVCILGNHEVMNMVGDYSYVADADLAGRAAAFSEGGEGLRLVRTLCSLLYAKDGVLYSHAGMTPAAAQILYGSGPLPPPDLAAVATERIASTMASGGVRALLQDPVIWGETGLTSTRAYYSPTRGGDFAIASMLDQLDVDRMVIGHNCLEQRVTTRYRGRVVLVDVGLSRSFAVTPSKSMLMTLPDGRAFELVSRGEMRVV